MIVNISLKSSKVAFLFRSFLNAIHPKWVQKKHKKLPLHLQEAGIDGPVAPWYWIALWFWDTFCCVFFCPFCCWWCFSKNFLLETMFSFLQLLRSNKSIDIMHWNLDAERDLGLKHWSDLVLVRTILRSALDSLSWTCWVFCAQKNRPSGTWDSSGTIPSSGCFFVENWWFLDKWKIRNCSRWRKCVSFFKHDFNAKECIFDYDKFYWGSSVREIRSPVSSENEVLNWQLAISPVAEKGYTCSLQVALSWPWAAKRTGWRSGSLPWGFGVSCS